MNKLGKPPLRGPDGKRIHTTNTYRRHAPVPGKPNRNNNVGKVVAGLALAGTAGASLVFGLSALNPANQLEEYVPTTTPPPPEEPETSSMVMLGGGHLSIPPPTPLEIAVLTTGTPANDTAYTLQMLRSEISPLEQNQKFEETFGFKWNGLHPGKTGGNRTFGIPESIIPIKNTTNLEYFEETNPAYKITPPHPAEIYRYTKQNQDLLPQTAQQFLSEYAEVWNNGQFTEKDYWKISDNLQLLWDKYPQQEYAKYIIALFNPENISRYTPTETQTWCHTWVIDVMNLLYGPKYYIPHTIFYNGDESNTQRQSTANIFIESVMSYGGAGRGWISVDAETAQRLAEDGNPIFAGTQNKTGSGHVFILMADQNGEIIITQAGRNNTGISIDENGKVSGTRFSAYVKETWNPGPNYTPVQFWVHETALNKDTDIPEGTISQQTGVEALQEILPGTNIFVSNSFYPQSGQRIDERSGGFIGHNNQPTNGREGNIYPSFRDEESLQYQIAQNAILHWATGQETNSTVDQTMQSRGRSVHFSIYINPQTQLPEIKVIAPFGFYKDDLIISKAMGAGLVGDQMHGLQFEIAGEYFQNHFNNLTQAQIDQLQNMTDSKIDQAFISNKNLASMTTVIVDLLYGLCERGVIQPSDIIGHFQLSLVGSSDPSPEYLGYVQARVLNKLIINGYLENYTYTRAIQNILTNPLHHIEQSSSSTVDSFIYYFGILGRGEPFDSQDANEILKDPPTHGPSQSYKTYYRRMIAQGLTPVSRRDHKIIVDAVAEGKLPSETVETAYNRKVLANTIIGSYKNQVNEDTVRALCNSLTKKGLIAIQAWRIPSGTKTKPIVWIESTTDPNWIELLSEISKLSNEIIEEALNKGYSVTEILRGILP